MKPCSSHYILAFDEENADGSIDAVQRYYIDIPLVADALPGTISLEVPKKRYPEKVEWFGLPSPFFCGLCDKRQKNINLSF